MQNIVCCLCFFAHFRKLCVGSTSKMSSFICHLLIHNLSPVPSKQCNADITPGLGRITCQRYGAAVRNSNPTHWLESHLASVCLMTFWQSYLMFLPEQHLSAQLHCVAGERQAFNKPLKTIWFSLHETVGRPTVLYTHLRKPKCTLPGHSLHVARVFHKAEPTKLVLAWQLWQSLRALFAVCFRLFYVRCILTRETWLDNNNALLKGGYFQNLAYSLKFLQSRLPWYMCIHDLNGNWEPTPGGSHVHTVPYRPRDHRSSPWQAIKHNVHPLCTPTISNHILTFI